MHLGVPGRRSRAARLAVDAHWRPRRTGPESIRPRRDMRGSRCVGFARLGSGGRHEQPGMEASGQRRPTPQVADVGHYETKTNFPRTWPPWLMR